jgi:hypothetical protein
MPLGPHFNQGLPPWQVPQPPPKRGNTTKIVLIVVGVVLLLCCGGAAVGGFALYRGVSQATGPVLASTNAFLGHLEAGENDAAYDGLCTSTRARFTRAQFDQIIAGRPRLTRHTVTGVNVSTVNGTATGVVNATIGYSDGSSDNHQFELTKNGGAWKVCGDPY